MPRGPKGEKRPADGIGKIATGEVEDIPPMKVRTPPPWHWGAYGWQGAGRRHERQAAQKRLRRRPPQNAGAILIVAAMAHDRMQVRLCQGSPGKGIPSRMPPEALDAAVFLLPRNENCTLDIWAGELIAAAANHPWH
jgi:hypothetical protein